jgi:hypothetical protein
MAFMYVLLNQRLLSLALAGWSRDIVSVWQHMGREIESCQGVRW